MVSYTVDAQVELVQKGYGQSSARVKAEKWAERLFNRLNEESRKQRFISWVLRRPTSLTFLHPEMPLRQVADCQHQTISLSTITGSCGGRSSDFDAQMRPRHQHNRNRWVSVAVAMRTGKSLPPVELVKVGDNYFVVDGHHRLSVAGAMEATEVEAKVTEWEVVPAG